MNAQTGRTITTSFHTTDLEEFRRFCRQARRLSEHGRVLVDLSTLSEEARHQRPSVRSPWHDYASRNSTLFAIFPHPLAAPFFPAEWVAANRALLLAKAAIAREEKLEATFYSHDPSFLPEAFFARYPHLRGPRIDHPRRSRQAEFALCTDLPEVLDMYAWMLAEFKRNVPNLGVYQFRTNDAGGGFCWAEWQYAGPNGPRHCQHRSVGERVPNFIKALHRGAEQGGGPIEVRLGKSNFWGNEEATFAPHLPPRTSMTSDGTTIAIPTMFMQDYPVQGLLDPVAIVAAMRSWSKPKVCWATLSGGTMYDRAGIDLGTIEKTLDIASAAIRSPMKGISHEVECLRGLCAGWVGEARADELLDALHQVNRCFSDKRLLAPQFHTYYGGVSMRYFTRPLVIKPELLSPQDEAYFLPHVFNPEEAEARIDYIDFHGGRIGVNPAVYRLADDPVRFPALLEVLQRMRGAASVIDRLATAPEAAWLRRLATALRIWASSIRSCHNFFFAQVICDRNRELLAGPPLIPPKVGSWTGHPDILAWNELMRDELDNANELIAELERGGLDQVARADHARDEDTFLLGPDLLGALRAKVRIMREHWLDVENYLSAPHK
jgi:hypothetical protein